MHNARRSLSKAQLVAPFLTLRNAMLALERNLFLKLCITEPALARMRSYEEKNVTRALALYRGLSKERES
jgi:hypothetical protein